METNVVLFLFLHQITCFTNDLLPTSLKCVAKVNISLRNALFEPKYLWDN